MDFRTKSNANRDRRIAKTAAVAGKRAELEKMFALIQIRHAKAMRDVDKRGEVLTTERFNAKGDRYTVETPNPFLRIAQRCESQLTLISRQLGKYGQQALEDGPVKGSARDVFGDHLEELLKGDDTCEAKSAN